MNRQRDTSSGYYQHNFHYGSVGAASDGNKLVRFWSEVGLFANQLWISLDVAGLGLAWRLGAAEILDVRKREETGKVGEVGWVTTGWVWEMNVESEEIGI